MAKTTRTKNRDLKIVKEETAPEAPPHTKAAPVTPTKSVNVLEEISLIGVTGGPDKGLLHSEGMDKFNFPELMIPAGLPLYFLPMGARLLNELADMIVNNTTGKSFAAGHRVQIGPFRFRLKACVYMNKLHWELSDEDMTGACASCGGPHETGEHAG